ncbi:phage integrase SAM-like domain-containing protein [Flavobacterium sp.]|jgi:integrase/recombinase XerD|uniref:phage integrase SAM-like domain-containing protein n=1 Tax=Flavobacterium sp. TaxID=239 RepID=UPI0037C0579B
MADQDHKSSFMANIKTLLDLRRAKSDGTFNIIFRITDFKKVYTFNSGVSLQQNYWDEKKGQVVKSHPNSKLLNIKLSKHYFKIEQAILTLDDEFSIEKLKAMLSGKPQDEAPETFQVFADKIIQQMMEANRVGNALVYQTAVNRLITYCGKDVSFEEVNYKLLDQFSYHLTTSGLKINSVSNYFRSIRAIYNKAIKMKVVDRSFYPFHDISIKSEKTAKRAILKDDIAKLLQIHVEKNSTCWKSLNYFMLSFFLRGISFTDLAYLKHSNIIDGRIEYKRRKTHKNYSVKLFPEAESIINQMRAPGSNYLLPIIPNGVTEDSIRAKRIIQQCIKTTNKYLKKLSAECGLLNSIQTYTSRHSFATIAKRMGYSNELVAESLGHEYGNKITNIYLDSFEVDVLDAMHQHVIKM